MFEFATDDFKIVEFHPVPTHRPVWWVKPPYRGSPGHAPVHPGAQFGWVNLGWQAAFLHSVQMSP